MSERTAKKLRMVNRPLFERFQCRCGQLINVPKKKRDYRCGVECPTCHAVDAVVVRGWKA